MGSAASGRGYLHGALAVRVEVGGVKYAHSQDDALRAAGDTFNWVVTTS